MNEAWSRVNPQTEQEKRAVAWIVQAQNDEAVRRLYHSYENNKLIRWKESIKRVVGVPLLGEPGLDI
jgi:hypothetical protein